jgi:hypothetical protein
MKLFHFPLLALALAGCDRATQPSDPAAASSPSLAAQATVHFIIREPLLFEITSPCTGQLIQFTGERFEQITAVGPQELLDQGIALRFEDQALFTGTGTEPVTGTAYYFRDVLHFGINSPTAEALNFTQTFQETLHATSPGSGQNFLIHVLIHVTVLPNGEVATSFEAVSAACQG